MRRWRAGAVAAAMSVAVAATPACGAASSAGQASACAKRLTLTGTIASVSNQAGGGGGSIVLHVRTAKGAADAHRLVGHDVVVVVDEAGAHGAKTVVEVGGKSAGLAAVHPGRHATVHAVAACRRLRAQSPLRATRLVAGG